jgi:Clostripain family
MARTRKPTMAEWTIMVFLNAKNNLEPFAFKNFEQMARVGSTDQVNVLVEFGRPRRHYTHESGGWSKTLRFRVEKDMEPVEHAAVEDLGATNMGDGESLVDFVTWARMNYPAKRTMLAIWDHGQGWRRRQLLNMRLERGALTRISHLRESARARLGAELGSLEPIPDDSRVHGAFRYVSHDEDTGDKLYNREIQDALAGLVRDAKIDVIGFDACLMAMLETAYALRDRGSVMVGSEELEPGDGWSYDDFLHPLVADPGGTDAAGLGSLMVEGYRKYYGNRDATTLSAIDLTKTAVLADAVSQFATTATGNLDEHLPALQRAREACENYAPGYGLHSIDLGRFLDQVTKAPGVNTTLAKKASDARAALHDLVIDNYASTWRQGSFGSEGVAIYFPKSRLEFDNDADGAAYRPGNAHYPVEFVDTQKWSNFIHAYLARAGAEMA